MKLIVAVSGGVDSAVLLHQLVQSGEHELIVAHFDHGIRQDSAADSRFVEGLAAQYGLPFVSKREELGEAASEELARSRRYVFLLGVAAEHGATVATAHHSDDIVETIVMNLHRGTGWRGLGVLGDERIYRPLARTTKQQLYAYALKHRLEWMEDATNRSDRYHRNRVRFQLASLERQDRANLIRLREEQLKLAHQIDALSRSMQTSSRYFFIMIDDDTALELLRAQLQAIGASLTRPQRRLVLHAIKTARAGTTIEAGSGIRYGFTRSDFIVKYPL